MEAERLEATARRASRARARGELRRAWLAVVELTVFEPERARWWVQRGVVADALGRDDEMRRAMRQALYLFRQQGDPGRAAAVSMWLARKGIAAEGACGLRGGRGRALRRAS